MSIEMIDKPLDGGWGYEEMSELECYQAERLAEIFSNEPMPEGWVVTWGAGVSYSGEGPEPTFIRPGYRGNVHYTQDNSRPDGERMVPSIKWVNISNETGRPA